MADPKRDDKAEQNSRAERSKQEAEQLIKTQREGEILTPSLFLGLLNGYLLFVTALAAVGVIAFYSHHLIYLEILFFACLLMIVIAPFGTAWFLRYIFPRKPTENGTANKQSLSSRLLSFTRKNLVRAGNNRIFLALGLALDIWMIAHGIYKFPSSPRVSLATIIFCTVSFCIFVLLLFINKTINIIEDIRIVIEKILNVLLYTYDISESSRKIIDETTRGHIELYENLFAALKATHETVKSIAKARPDKPPELESPSLGTDKCEGDEWINDCDIK